MGNCGYDIQLSHGRCRLEAIRDNIIHCVYTLQEEASDASALGIGKKAQAELGVEEREGTVRLFTADLALEIDKQTGKFVWKNSGGKLLLREDGKELAKTPFVKYVPQGEDIKVRREKTIDGERNFAENLVPVTTHTAYRGKIYFDFQEDERICGFGQGEEGILNYRGQVQYLYQHNMRIPVPFFVSDKKYAILADCGCLMIFQDDQRGSYLFMDCVEQIDYYFIYGERVDELIAGFRMLTGKAAMLPKWAFGYVQSKEAYHTQEEILETAKKYRDAGLPIDLIVQDWNTWESGKWGNKKVDKRRYPDVAGMNRQLHEMHVHSMISIWPSLGREAEDYAQMAAQGYLLADQGTYNAFLEEARGLYWKQMKEELYDGGFDAWWCDSTEPFSGPDWNGEYQREPWERFYLVGAEHKKYLDADRANLYALAHARGIYENQKKTNEDKRVLNLTRSGYASIQKYGTVLWSGDICATWDTFKKQITEGINMGISGMPYWTLDIGGFFVVNENWRHRGCGGQHDPSMKWFWKGDYEEGTDDLGYRELYVRWFQYGAFLPVFRSHGTDTPREIWNFGGPGELFYEALKDTLRLRYRLMPYIYSAAGMTWLRDDTMVRGLMFDYADDEAAREVSDEYLFGRSFLVCPVTEPMYYGRNSRKLERDKIRRCYLPAGNAWYDYYTGELYQGGRWVSRDTPIGEIPLFVKAGSVIPMEQKLMYAQEAVETPLELRIYDGADAVLDYYEDSGEGYGYEKGDYQVIQVRWDDWARTLTIGRAEKDYPQSMKGRTCIATLRGQSKEFQYDGEEIELKFT